MNFYYTRLVVLSALLLPSSRAASPPWGRLGGTNPTIPEAKQGQDCRIHVFGLGGVPDMTGTQAMRAGGITKLRRAEYRATTFFDVGRECVIAYGE